MPLKYVTNGYVIPEAEEGSSLNIQTDSKSSSVLQENSITESV